MDQIDNKRKKDTPNAKKIQQTQDIYDFIKDFTPAKVTGSDKLPQFVRLGRVWKKDRKKKNKNCLIVPPFVKPQPMELEETRTG